METTLFNTQNVWISNVINSMLSCIKNVVTYFVLSVLPFYVSCPVFVFSVHPLFPHSHQFFISVNFLTLFFTAILRLSVSCIDLFCAPRTFVFRISPVGLNLSLPNKFWDLEFWITLCTFASSDCFTLFRLFCDISYATALLYCIC